MKTIVIAGEGSYIGTHLQEYLRQQTDVYAVKVYPTVGIDPQSFDISGTDAVINVAAIVHRKETPETLDLYYSVNQDFAINLAKKAKEENVPLFIQFSTMSVYGKQTGIITKDSPLHPVTAYAKSKLEAERGLASLVDDHFAVSILRPPMVYGPGAKGNYHLLEKLTDYLFFCPTFQNKRSLVSIDHLCKAVYKCIQDARSGIFFPQDPFPISTVSLIEQIAACKGKKLRKTSIFNPLIKFLTATTGMGKKAFGNLLYQDLFELPLSSIYAEDDSKKAIEDHAFVSF